MLHTLRYLIGEESVREALRLMAYPTEEAAWATDGSQVRFASTADVVATFNAVSGRDLAWLFEAYLREAELPTLRAVLAGTSASDALTLTLRWETPGGQFPMPVDVEVDGKLQRVSFEGTTARIPVPTGAKVRVDPENWILRHPYGDPLRRDTWDE